MIKSTLPRKRTGHFLLEGIYYALIAKLSVKDPERILSDFNSQFHPIDFRTDWRAAMIARVSKTKEESLHLSTLSL